MPTDGGERCVDVVEVPRRWWWPGHRLQRPDRACRLGHVPIALVRAPASCPIHAITRPQSAHSTCLLVMYTRPPAPPRCRATTSEVVSTTSESPSTYDRSPSSAQYPWCTWVNMLP